jgi:DNA-binding IclR family transcriptional regulator
MDTELERVHDEEEADARRTIVRILNRAPYDVWTRDSLARSVGVPASLTERILIQLTRSGIVQRLDDSDEIEYTVATDAY